MAILVNLRNDWFGPDSSLHSAVNNPHEFPDEWAELLPSSASVVEPREPVAPEPEGEAVEEELDEPE